MTTPLPVNGRGAWTKLGKDNGSIYYEYIVGKPVDGSSPTQDQHHEAVNLAVKAIQLEINQRGYAPPLTVDGYFGGKSKEAATWVQGKLGVAKPDGRIGAGTARLLWRRQIERQSNVIGIAPKYLWGIMLHESTGDPGAVGYYTPSDRGLVQINIVAHSDITAAQAHNTEFAFRYTAQRFKTYLSLYAEKGPELQEICSIAQHNSPTSAKTWYDTGEAPNSKIENYVNAVLSLVNSW